MGAKRTEPAGLSHAQDVIHDLEHSLRWTLDSVEVLTRNGQHAEVRELIEAQRAELDDVVRSLARDAAVTRRHRMSVASRSLAAAAAAAVAVLSIGVAMMRNSGASGPQTLALEPATTVHTSASSAAAAVAPLPKSAAIPRVTAPTQQSAPHRIAPPVANNRVRSAVRADGPTVNPAATASAPAVPIPSPLPEYLRRIN